MFGCVVDSPFLHMYVGTAVAMNELQFLSFSMADMNANLHVHVLTDLHIYLHYPRPPVCDHTCMYRVVDNTTPCIYMYDVMLWDSSGNCFVSIVVITRYCDNIVSRLFLSYYE